jgi:hypothetical protein
VNGREWLRLIGLTVFTSVASGLVVMWLLPRGPREKAAGDESNRMIAATEDGNGNAAPISTDEVLDASAPRTQNPIADPDAT